jgi:hypothetical protein
LSLVKVSCVNVCLSSKSMYQMSKRLGQSMHKCLDWPHRKHTTGVALIACAGVVWDGFEAMATCGVYHKSEGDIFTTLTSGLQNIMLVNEDVSECVAMHEEVLKASLVIWFSSQRIAATYHSWGFLSEGCPLVRQAT